MTIHLKGKAETNVGQKCKTGFIALYDYMAKKHKRTPEVINCDRILNESTKTV
jgi:hypothetical protein